jgi:hypothetical protein
MTTDPQPVVGQKLDFGVDGKLEVVASFTSPTGLLHKTADGGFFFGPNKPLTDQEIADKLPEPYKTEATEFIANLPVPEAPVEGA